MKIVNKTSNQMTLTYGSAPNGGGQCGSIAPGEDLDTGGATETVINSIHFSDSYDGKPPIAFPANATLILTQV